MKSILFITSNFLPNADATGICTYNLAKSYIARGYRVFCISQQGDHKTNHEVIDQIEIYRVKDSFHTRFTLWAVKKGQFIKLCYKLWGMLRRLLTIWFYPNKYPLRSHCVLRQAERLIASEKIDTVIAAHGPYEGVYAALKLKERYGERLHCISWYLDLLWQKKGESRIGKRLYDKKMQAAQCKDFALLDHVLIPQAAYKEFVHFYGEQPHVSSFDFPIFVKETGTECDFSFESGVINVAFVGSLSLGNRNPETVLRVFSALKQKGVDIKLHIWGYIPDTREIIEKYSDVAEYHGTVEYKYIFPLLQKADYLLNISNKVTYDMVPSKIFQLFATGKPILHFVTNENDCTGAYFEKYGNACFLREYCECVDDLSEQLQVFLQGSHQLAVRADQLFIENTPEYLLDKIEERKRNA